MRRLFFCVLMLGWLGTVSASFAQSPTPALPQADAELADFAGEYSEGNGRYGTSITVHREGWYRFTTSSDYGPVTKSGSRGMAWTWNGQLILKPKVEMRTTEAWARLATRFLLVRWGERRYLVRAKDQSVVAFCNSINLGEEPRTSPWVGFPYLRAGGEKLQVTGMPELPEKWREYVLQTPVRCKVTVVEGTESRVDAGARAGLREGMVLVARERYRWYRVRRVEESSAFVVPEWRQVRDLPPLAGEELSTREWKNL